MSCSGGVLALHLACELVAQLREVDPAQVDREPLGMVLARLLRADGLVDDPVQFLEHLGHVGGVAPLLQLLVDGLDVVVALGVGERARLHQQRLEAVKTCRAMISKRRLASSRRVQRVHGVAQRLDAGETLRRAGGPGRSPGPSGASPPLRWPEAGPHQFLDGRDDLRRLRRRRHRRRPGRTAPAPPAGS